MEGAAIDKAGRRWAPVSFLRGAARSAGKKWVITRIEQRADQLLPLAESLNRSAA